MLSIYYLYDADARAGTVIAVAGQRLQPQHQSLLSKQEAQNAASVVQILKTELADKIKSLACKQSEGRVRTGMHKVLNALQR